MPYEEEILEAKGLYKNDKLIGTISLFKDESVGVCMQYPKPYCYVTEPKSKAVYWISQSWFSALMPDLEIKKLI